MAGTALLCEVRLIAERFGDGRLPDDEKSACPTLALATLEVRLRDGADEGIYSFPNEAYCGELRLLSKAEQAAAVELIETRRRDGPGSGHRVLFAGIGGRPVGTACRARCR